MESIETKEISTGLEEPIKSETIVPSSETSGRNNGASSPPPHCSICLEQLINTSFTDSCLHQFCFTCLLQWSKIKTECPLCKQTFKSIIHNVRSEGDYDQYHVQYSQQVSATLDVAADAHLNRRWDMALTMPVCPFMYRTTLGARGRYGVLLNSQAVARHEQIPSISFQVSSEERRRRNNNPIDYRRSIYRHGRYASPLPDAFGRLRTCNAEYYRRNPSEIDRLIPFLNRELQVLLNNNRPHISYVMRIITDVLTQFDITSEEFANLIRPYFGIHTPHFVHEFSNYANSNFDLIGYDQAVTYNSNRGLSTEYVPRAVSPSSSSSSSTDSDVRVVNEGFDAYRWYSPSVGPHLIDMPGPSTVSQAFRINSTPDVLTISSTSSESENECEVVGYVKPRHERTPEIINLSSSEHEDATNPSLPNLGQIVEAEVSIEIRDENLPSTSSSCDNSNKRTRGQTDSLLNAQMFEYFNSISESESDDESDSDYNPSRSKSRRHKTSSKKASKTTPRKARTRSRKKSVSSQRKRDKDRRTRLSSCDSDESLQREKLPNSRGTKRYHSMSSEESEFEIKVKKNKKSKKAKKSSKKSKKSKVVCFDSDSYSSGFSDFESDKNKSSKKKSKKSSKATSSHRYSSEERLTNDKSSKASSSRKSKQKTNPISSKYINDSDSSDFSHQSSASFESHKLSDRLDMCRTDRLYLDKEDSCRSQSSNRSIFSDEASSSCPKEKSSTKATVTSDNASSSHSSDVFSSASASSSKSGISSPVEHSESKATRDKHRSHKKHKESKKRKRSRS